MNVGTKIGYIHAEHLYSSGAIFFAELEIKEITESPDNPNVEMVKCYRMEPFKAAELERIDRYMASTGYTLWPLNTPFTIFDDEIRQRALEWVAAENTKTDNPSTIKFGEDLFHSTPYKP